MFDALDCPPLEPLTPYCALLPVKLNVPFGPKEKHNIVIAESQKISRRSKVGELVFGAILRTTESDELAGWMVITAGCPT